MLWEMGRPWALGATELSQILLRSTYFRASHHVFRISVTIDWLDQNIRTGELTPNSPFLVLIITKFTANVLPVMAQNLHRPIDFYTFQ